MGKKTAIEQFNYKFPDNEKHLGLENVSEQICIGRIRRSHDGSCAQIFFSNFFFLNQITKQFSMSFFSVGFKHLLHQLSHTGLIALQAVPGAGAGVEAVQQREILLDQ